MQGNINLLLWETLTMSYTHAREMYDNPENKQ